VVTAGGDSGDSGGDSGDSAVVTVFVCLRRQMVTMVIVVAVRQ
jgi:hypothetical protein